MKVEKIDHFTILVKDLEKTSKFFADLFETEFSEFGEFKETDVRTVIEPLGIELIEPLTPDGPPARVIESRGEGFASLSFKVSNLEEAVAEMKSRGIRQVAELKRGNWKEVLFHPKDTYGVMIVLTEYKAKHPMATAITE